MANLSDEYYDTSFLEWRCFSDDWVNDIGKASAYGTLLKLSDIKNPILKITHTKRTVS